MTSFRSDAGGLIDRGRKLSFRFDGEDYDGHPGDTLASALLANGVRLVGRSFKYHRPRGFLAAGAEEPNGLVELREGARREANTRATVVELFDGLVAHSQNRWPSLNFDLLSVNSLAGPIFAAGFYYKTFMWPAAFWEKLYEPLIRRAAGLGRAAGTEDPDHYEQANAFCDVLVIGAGPAGLAAALAAGRSGARVILADEDFRPGGRLLSDRREIGGRPAAEWVEATLAELRSLPEVRILSRTTVFGVYDHGAYGAVERVADHRPEPQPFEPRQRLWRIVARRSILAAGAIERPMVFPGNDRPGIMLAGAARSYANRYGVAAGSRAVVYTAGDDGWRSVADLAAAGSEIAAVVDTRHEVAPEHRALAERLGARLVAGGQVCGTAGGKSLAGVEIVGSDGRKLKVDADLLAMSNGWNPAVHLTCHLGAKPRWDGDAEMFVPGTLPPGMAVVGAAAGQMALDRTLAEGLQAGTAAATEAGFAASAPAAPPADAEGRPARAVWRVPAGKGKAFVDFQHDVTAPDLALAHREGFRPVEHLKRYTTLGMATDQGKTSNVTAIAIMAELTGKSIPETGTTVFRPPYTPVALGALAGHHRGRDFRPVRLTPSHRWATEQGAEFIEAGAWMRAQYFPRAGETHWRQTVDREVLAVRNGVGVCDVSTLGKIDVQGRDAAAFLDRLYCNGFAALPVGKARYGLMLREDGFVMDDGTTARLGDCHFLVSTTTANAAKVMQHMDYCHQVLWPTMDVRMVSVTEQWAQFSIAGPKSRAVLQALVDPGCDVSDAGLPYLGVREMTVAGGLKARLFRISFSGELAYELAVPAAYGDAAIRAIIQAGAAHGIVPYGTEALGVMRIEKGHVAGNELNGQTTAADLGLGRMMSTKKDFIGRLMARRPALCEADRPALVGFKPVDTRDVFGGGAHFVAVGKPAEMAHDEGYVTSVAFSPVLGHMIGLGLIKGGAARIGQRVRAVDPVRGRDTLVELCSPHFVDPEGVRVHG
ncbi:MAG: sarcosine oxidase subunit alpha family protein [Ferrovibrionaceae bacterium]